MIDFDYYTGSHFFGGLVGIIISLAFLISEYRSSKNKKEEAEDEREP